MGALSPLPRTPLPRSDTASRVISKDFLVRPFLSDPTGRRFRGAPAPPEPYERLTSRRLVPAADQAPASTGWRSTRRFQAEAVRLYQEGRSLSSIRRELGIAWDSVARLLDRGGVRERKTKAR